MAENLAQVSTIQIESKSQTTAGIADHLASSPRHTATEGPELASEAGRSAESAPSEHGADNDLRRILSIEVPVIVQLAYRRLKLSEVMRLSTGAIIEFTKSADDELDLLANNKTIGKGVAVKVGENFGVKISAMGAPQETIQKLGQ